MLESPGRCDGYVPIVMTRAPKFQMAVSIAEVLLYVSCDKGHMWFG